jgi:hypothetical protein
MKKPTRIDELPEKNGANDVFAVSATPLRRSGTTLATTTLVPTVASEYANPQNSPYNNRIQ